MHWYLNIADFEVFSKSIVERKEFSCLQVVLSPDCSKLAFIDKTSFLTVRDLKTSKEIAHFRIYCRDWWYVYDFKLCFSYDSCKLAINNNSNQELMVFNTETRNFEESYEYKEISYMVPSKSDYTLALVSINNLTITIQREGKIMRKIETEKVKCLDFTASNSDICCYSSKNNLNIWINFQL